jgi:flagellar FliL protein
MAERRDPKDDEEDAPQAAAKQTSKGSGMLKMLLLALGMVLLSAGSAIGALYFAGAGPFAAPASDDESADAQAGAKDKSGKKKKKAKDGQAAEENKPQSVSYLALDPPFVVNLRNPTEARYLQVNMEVMARDPQVIEDVKKHMPAIRDSLLLLLSSQTYETLASAEGKERIRAEALAAVQKILQTHTGKPGVEAIYFTGFVMQ